MSLGPDDIRRVAALAQLDIPEKDIPRLAAELNAIVGYVGRLGDPAADPAGGNDETPTALREDVVAPTPLSLAPGTLAPEFRDGFFLVPKLAAMDGA